MGVCLYIYSLENVTISPIANLETITLYGKTLNTFPDGLVKRVRFFAKKYKKKRNRFNRKRFYVSATGYLPRCAIYFLKHFSKWNEKKEREKERHLLKITA
jgi:hypothetical protein